MQIEDMIIIGGGPVGLFGATMAKLHGLSVTMIESLTALGGQLYALYPEKPIYDVAGFYGITGKDLANRLIEQSMHFSPTVKLGHSVIHIAPVTTSDSLYYQVETDQEVLYARVLLITVGIGAFVPRRLTAPEAESLEGHGVHYFVPPLEYFHHRRVMVVGGGDTALDWTLAVAPYADQVILVHRRTEFRGQEESIRLIAEKSNITTRTPYEVIHLGGHAQLESVTLKHVTTGEESQEAVDDVIGGLGFLPSLGPVKTWGVTLQGNTIPVDPSSMLTNLPGVYAAGDVAAYLGKVKLIATGFGEIGLAIAHIRNYLDPTKKGLPHSSNLKNLPF